MKYDTNYHKPIMVDEIENLLALKSDGIYLDGTLGGGGHSEMILEMSSPNGKLIGIDKDGDALKFAGERLAKYGERFTAIKSDYLYANSVLDNLNVDKLDGVLLDLGVSSFQLDNFERGFSYRSDDAKLDMRMDETQNFSAYDVVNGYSVDELKRIFFEYGEEKFSNRIATNIGQVRATKPIETCGELVEIIKQSIPAKFRFEGGHPAKRVFQAIRIEVNGEIKDLENAVTNLVRRLKVGGRMCVITFHSLEDRIVKNVFRELEKDCICDKSLPICVCGKVQEVKILTKKPIVASGEEELRNPRASSAKLRAIEKV
ncbi:MAG: 16S rRNA (cytosine(1402)-N(4))-methyltransferase RsmH [Clostridia bacterium]